MSPVGMSRRSAALAVCLLACAWVVAASPYTDQYDTIDLDEILNNDRLYNKYFRCLTGQGKCTPEGKELKDILPEAIATACGECSLRQRRRGVKVLRHIIEKRPDDWEVLEKLYDPEGVYRRKYHDLLKEGLRLENEPGKEGSGAGSQGVESATQEDGSGTQEDGSGMQKAGSGTQKASSGTQEDGSDTQKASSGTQEAGSGTQSTRISS